jgi:DNA-binding transcriptional LysR family regulator
MTIWKRNPLTPQYRDHIAEVVANGGSISQAAREIGICQQMASKHWAAIKAGLGAQAI